MALALWLAPAARGAPVANVLGIPCSNPGDGTQLCQGDLAHRVRSFDGVPLDMDLRLPPAAQDGPFPLIVWLHGYGENKSTSVPQSLINRVKKGYALLAYSARGFGGSCGTPASQADPGCAKGYIRLADARYEVRDTQYLAGLLADKGLVQPREIGVTGHSYGAGQSYMLATLRDRVMRPNGRLRPWTSPEGKPMRIAAAMPEFGWTDLAASLMPNGRTLDSRPNNPYGVRVGVEKQSYVSFLYLVGAGAGFYAPPGTDPEADITNWYTQINQGEPYDTNPDAKAILDQVERFHSAYYLQRALPRDQQERPAPILAYNAWTDDLFPAEEAIRYYDSVRARWPNAEFSLLFADGQGHPRASLVGSTPGLDSLRNRFFDRLLKHAPGRPLGVRTLLQGCDSDPAAGPFDSRTWAAQHAGNVRFLVPGAHALDQTSGDPGTGSALDPFAGGSCRTTAGADDPSAVTYRFSKIGDRGFTLLGAPRVALDIETADPLAAQVDSRLWDVAPDGSQRLVTRGVYRPNASGRQVFQLHPNGWRFAPDHVVKLELVGRDAPYARPSNGSFSVSLRDLRLRLPTRQRCPIVTVGGPKRNRLEGTGSGDRMFGLAGEDKLFGLGGGDCLFGGPDGDTEIGGAGNDRLDGGAGADSLVDVKGTDVLVGGTGNDVLVAADGGRDVLRCGLGFDYYVANRSDVVSDCERRLRP